MHYAELIWQKQSEERGIKIVEERGEEKERRKSICFFIRGCKNLGICMEDIAKQLMDMYQLTYNDAMNKIHDIWGYIDEIIFSA